MDLIGQDSKRKAGEDLVRYLVDCMIKHDIGNIVQDWIFYALKTTTPHSQIKEIVEIILACPFLFHVARDGIIMFDSTSQYRGITTKLLSKDTMAVLDIILEKNEYFFQEIDVVHMEYIVLKKFLFIEVINSSGLREKLVLQLLQQLIRPDVNESYFKGRIIEVLLSFVDQEISKLYDIFVRYSRHQDDWLPCNMDKIKILDSLHDRLVLFMYGE